MAGFLSIVFGRILPAIVLLVAVAIGWLASHELPAGVFFATVGPLLKGYMPPTIVGHGKMKGTPAVPADQPVEARPANELFLDLPDSNFKMPAVGIGMCCRPTAYDDVLVRRTVLWYLLSGGRHIDGAQLYLNHKAVGLGIQDAMKRGIPREEIFVTTKVSPTHFGYDTTLQTVPTFLEELGLDYIDLVLLHMPGAPRGFGNSCKKNGIDPPECRRQTWKALSELRARGVIRHVGVSNFVIRHLQDLQKAKDAHSASSDHWAPIANNQIQYSPFVPSRVQETFDYCMSNNITVTAYSPLGGMFDTKKAQAVEILGSLATKYNASWAQIMLRWALQVGAAVIPGTGNPKHMRQNLAIYDFVLSAEDMKAINSLKHADEAKKFMHLDMTSQP